MKKRAFVGFCCLLLALWLPVCALGAANRPIAVTAYRQVGWGDSVQIGYVDEAGNLWYLEGNDHQLEWPYSLEEQLEWLASAKGFALLGTLERDDLFTLNSLVQCVESQGTEMTPAANDAGREASYAVRYGGDQPEVVLLGVSGDDRFENTDPTAQALYLYLRQAFPGVTSYWGTPHMGPVGFVPVSLMKFCGVEGVNLSGATVTRRDIDCEAGTEPVTLSAEEGAAVLQEIQNNRVTGKHSCIVTTGGSVVYAFADASGKQLASFEFYHGLLVTQDGMYNVAP